MVCCNVLQKKKNELTYKEINNKFKTENGQVLHMLNTTVCCTYMDIDQLKC